MVALNLDFVEVSGGFRPAARAILGDLTWIDPKIAHAARRRAARGLFLKA
jgi:hypothetical protein